MSCDSCAGLQRLVAELRREIWARAEALGTLRGQLDYTRVLAAAKDREIAKLQAEIARRGRVVEARE